MQIHNATYKPFDPEKEIYEIPDNLSMVVEREIIKKEKKDGKNKDKSDIQK